MFHLQNFSKLPAPACQSSYILRTYFHIEPIYALRPKSFDVFIIPSWLLGKPLHITDETANVAVVWLVLHTTFLKLSPHPTTKFPLTNFPHECQKCETSPTFFQVLSCFSTNFTPAVNLTSQLVDFYDWHKITVEVFVTQQKLFKFYIYCIIYYYKPYKYTYLILCVKNNIPS